MQSKLYGVCDNDKCGYIDSNGKIIVPLEADECLQFSEGIGGLINGNSITIINMECVKIGECLGISTTGDWFSNGLLPIKSLNNKSRLTGYIDRTGNWVISPKFRDGRMFFNKVAIIDDGSNLGLVDTSGNWICSPEFHQILNFSHDTSCTVAYKKMNGKMRCMLLDRNGQQVGFETFDYGHRANEGLIPVCKDSKWGFVDEKGKLEIPFLFEGLNAFSSGLAAARGENGLIGFIDRNGQWQIHPKFEDVGYFKEGLCFASIKLSNGFSNYGYIDESGAWEIEPQFGDALEFANGIACVRPKYTGEPDSRFGYIDRTGKYIWEPTC